MSLPGALNGELYHIIFIIVPVFELYPSNSPLVASFYLMVIEGNFR